MTDVQFQSFMELLTNIYYLNIGGFLMILVGLGLIAGQQR